MKTKYVPPVKEPKVKRVRRKASWNGPRITGLVFIILDAVFLVAGVVFVVVAGGDLFADKKSTVTYEGDGVVSVYAENPYNMFPLMLLFGYLFVSVIATMVVLFDGESKNFFKWTVARLIAGLLGLAAVFFLAVSFGGESVDKEVADKLGVMFYDDEKVEARSESDLTYSVGGVNAPKLRDDVFPVARMFDSEATSDFYKIVDVEWNENETAVSYRIVPAEEPQEAE